MRFAQVFLVSPSYPNPSWLKAIHFINLELSWDQSLCKEN